MTEERAHSKLSASGAERWFQCPGSVHLSEGLPDKGSSWAREGTEAHKVLEELLKRGRSNSRNKEMLDHAMNAARFIKKLFLSYKDAEFLTEEKVHLSFIHPEMFGTFDSAVIDYFGTLHVFDYKYGAGHPVSPTKNLQMIFYGLGLAYKYQWNFKRVRLWIIQPRIKGYDGPVFWELSLKELMEYIPEFKKAVARVEKSPTVYNEGAHCHWCRAKSICPLKREGKLEQARSIFTKIQ